MKAVVRHNIIGSAARIGIALSLLTPLPVLANPVVLEPTSLFAFVVVAFWALVVEAGIVALLLTVQGLNPLRMFMAYGVINIAVFTFVFMPLLDEERASIPLLEALVVALDCLAIKLLARFGALQADNYKGISWLRCLVISCIGNAVSYFIGNIASHKPWEH